MPQRARLLLHLPLALTVLFWGFNFPALRVLYEQMATPAVALVRFGLMYAALLLVCAVLRVPLRMERADAWRIHFFGLMSMGVYMVFFLEGLRGAAPAEAAIVLNTSPIMTMLLAAALGQERLRSGSLAGAVIAFAGVVLVITSGASVGGGTLQGNLLILASAAIWAYCVVLMKPLLERYSPVRLLTLSMPAGLLVLVPYGGLHVLNTNFGALSGASWMFLFHVSVLSGVVAFIGFYAGVKRVGGGGAMLAMFFVPPMAAFFSWLLLGRTLAPIQFGGLAVVILGVATAQRFRGAGSSSERSVAVAAEGAEGTL